jgi:hypothetical protein
MKLLSPKSRIYFYFVAREPLSVWCTENIAQRLFVDDMKRSDRGGYEFIRKKHLSVIFVFSAFSTCSLI